MVPFWLDYLDDVMVDSLDLIFFFDVIDLLEYTLDLCVSFGVCELKFLKNVSFTK